MFLRRIHIRNVRSIADLVWELPPEAAGPGWHVILGDNGSGKSSLLRAIALALVGPWEAPALRQPWNKWIRTGTKEARITITVEEPDATPASETFRLVLSPTPTVDEPISSTQMGHLGVGLVGHAQWKHMWGPGPAGGGVVRGRWFCASYGPFRRFTGGDNELEQLYVSQPRLARHLSMFGEAVALTEALSWMQSLKFKQLEGNSEGDLLASIKTFINQPGFLPYGLRVHDVTSSGVDFVDANGFTVPVQDLSDGYRSVLSMTFELIRQMALTYDAATLFSSDHSQVVESGIVIVDEIDAHLHPSWQRTIGVWFQRHFPNVQFIVSTHSPLVCQAAEGGSVFRLAQPSADPSSDRGEMVTGLALKRLLYGSVLDAYGTGVFGEGVERSDSGQEKLERLAELNTQELVSPLTPTEQRDQAELRAILATDADTTITP
jgi:energy-coupling factor transporter ATP-binding protein EcfA2